MSPVFEGRGTEPKEHCPHMEWRVGIMTARNLVEVKGTLKKTFPKICGRSF